MNSSSNDTVTAPRLRTDVVFKRAWPVTEYNYVPVMPNPEYNIYTVCSDAMVPVKHSMENFRDVIYPKTDLSAETIPVSMIIPDHLYIVTDIAENTFLAKISAVNPGQAIRLQFLNPDCRDVLLHRNQIATVALVYMSIVHHMTEEQLDELDRLDF